VLTGAHRLSALQRPAVLATRLEGTVPNAIAATIATPRAGILAADRGCVLPSNVAILWFCHAQFSNMNGN
jgi:hypothetical protein